ncbi:MAG: hypothetical protein ACKOWX_02830 [Flavobacteriales bacterium]
MRANDSLIQLRPEVLHEAMESSPIEKFQNEVLRPILKFQHELLLEEWRVNPLFKQVKESPNPAQKRKLLGLTFSKNTGLLQRLIGTVVGLLTTEEFNFYMSEKALIDKRIKELLLTRLLSYDEN